MKKNVTRIASTTIKEKILSSLATTRERIDLYLEKDLSTLTKLFDKYGYIAGHDKGFLSFLGAFYADDLLSASTCEGIEKIVAEAQKAFLAGTVTIEDIIQNIIEKQEQQEKELDIGKCLVDIHPFGNTFWNSARGVKK